MTQCPVELEEMPATCSEVLDGNDYVESNDDANGSNGEDSKENADNNAGQYCNDGANEINDGLDGIFGKSGIFGESERNASQDGNDGEN